MNNKQLPTKPIILGLTLTSLILGSLGILKPLITPKIASAISLNQSPFQLALRFRLPPKGAPGRRRGAGTRQGYCSSDERLIALMPGTNLGLTVAERPTFWFYVPYQGDKLEAEFLLEDNEGNEVYQEIVALNNTPGIVKVSLPENFRNPVASENHEKISAFSRNRVSSENHEKISAFSLKKPGFSTDSTNSTDSLEVEQLYVWRLSVICNPDNRFDDDYVWGGVERVSMSFELKNQLKDKTKRERLKIYAENGLWFDVLTTLAELREANVEDQELDEDWVELLEQALIDLEEISDQPLVDCCTSEQ
ncbi:MAG: DUF928 domain-containing protein [Symploca sp. SIO2E6]|nr:DUF928 domain-containing protein [Symploca sp. SIO2E6]